MNNFIRLSGLAVVMAVLFCVDALALNGGWRGELVLGEMKIPLVFNFSENGNGETSCTTDSPSQGAKEFLWQSCCVRQIQYVSNVMQ